MPSNAQYADLLDELKASIDPMDAATLFAGLRNSVPLSMLFRSGDTNVGHDEELAKRRGPATMPAPPTIDPAESNRRAQMDFEMQYPDPRIRQLLIDEMLKQSRDPYSPTTATRRRDFEDAPMSAQHYMSAAPKKRKFANGGAIDFSTPDMADGGRFIPDPQLYNKGGGVKKSLDEMMAEMAKKGVKVADKPDFSRRSFFGLGAKPAFPLANLDTKALEKMQSDLKGAPAITEKTVTVDPGKGAAKSTLKSLSETPMSRREVLQSAAGQVMRGVLPELGGLSSLGNVAKVAESVAPVAAPAFTNPYAMIMSMLKQGKSEEDIIKLFAKEKPDVNKYALNQMIDNVYNPAEYLAGDLPTLKTPSGALREIAELSEGVWDDHLSPIKMRPELRQLRSADPDAYKGMVDAARDISMSSVEEATNLGLKQKWIDKFMRGEISYDKLPQYYQRKIDNINAGFGGE